MATDTPQELRPNNLVQEGYDAMATEYLSWATQKETPRPAKIASLLSKLKEPRDAKILELGCGAGIPGTQLLAERCREVVANDISEKQIELAKATFASASNVEFLQGDMMGLEFQPNAFDAVVALYSLFHLPRDEQHVMLKRIHSWLGSGGMLMCNLGVADDPGSVSNWLGTQMYWSQFSASKNIELLKEAGFDLLDVEIIEEMEDGRSVPFQWILARKV